MNIDLKSIVYFLDMQGKSPNTILLEINETFKKNVIAYPTITKYLREKIYNQKENTSRDLDIISRQENKNELILDALHTNPYSSVREISYMTGISKSSVYRILTVNLNYQIKRLRYVPHFLTSSQKVKRVKLAQLLLQTIKNARHQNFSYFYTGDESWFYLSNDHEKIWLAPEEEIPLRERKMIYTKKFMVSIFWNVNGFLLIDILDEGSTFNSDYFIHNILERINGLTQEWSEKEQRNITLHFDNARPHTAEKVRQYMKCNKMKRAPHPPYSPDIAPSDFYLFGYIKEKLKGCTFNSAEQLLDAIIQISEDISKETLKKVFLHWEKRLQKVIDTNGDFY